MSDEHYRRLEREGGKSGLYDRAAYEALRLGRIDDVRRFMLGRLLPHTIADIVSELPELSYRAVEWFTARRRPEKGICRKCNEGSNALPMRPCREGHRAPTLHETLTLLDGHAQEHTAPDERMAAERMLCRNRLDSYYDQTIGVSNAIHRGDQTLTFYEKPQLKHLGPEDPTEMPHSQISNHLRKERVQAEAETLPLAAFLARHPTLRTHLYAPQHFTGPITIRVPHSEYGHPLILTKTYPGFEIRISEGTTLMPIYVRER